MVQYQLFSTYVIGHHDCEQGFIGSIYGHIECCGLEQHKQRVHDHVGYGEQKVWDHPNVLSFAASRLRGCPK
jgi:hypothetical protein